MDLSKKLSKVLQNPLVTDISIIIKKFRHSKSYWSVITLVIAFTFREAIAAKYGEAIKDFMTKQAEGSDYAWLWNMLGFIFGEGGSWVLVTLGITFFLILSWLKNSENKSNNTLKEKSIDKEIKNLPSDVLSQITPGASLELVTEKFGAAERIYTETPAFFGDDFIQSKSYFYAFDNANMEIDSLDKEVVESITIHNFSDEIISVDYINDLGVLTAQDILDQVGTLGKVISYTQMRYSYIAIECQSDRTGGYFYYTFVCFDWTYPDLYNATFKNDKLYNSKGEEIALKNIIFESVSVSSLENHGHPACRMMLE